ncbi:MAG: sugar phosphate isomerase/epimerase [Spirochaetales bacterium]
MKIALSTMWGIKRFPQLKDFFSTAESIGFSRFELNHGVTSQMLTGLDGRTITSVHEPCPADISVEALREKNYLISALTSIERGKGIEAIQRSIDLAKNLGAPLVIVHPGRVEMDTGIEDSLRNLYRAGNKGTEAYRALIVKYRQERNRQALQNLKAVKESLKELLEYAIDRGICLGLENRYYYHEIPTPEELEELLSLAPPEHLGFWYDVGHAEVLDRLGLIPHSEWLERFSHRIVGVHFHDVEGIDDHKPAGYGTVPWDSILSFLPRGIPVTCEFQNTWSAQEIQEGAQYLQRKGIA